MIARPRYAWSLPSNVIDNMISIDIDIEMLERIKSIMRTRITEMAESCRYTDLAEVLEDYLKLEQLSIIYEQKKEEKQKREEEQNNDVLPEDESSEQ